MRVLLFTDTLGDVNGVSRFIRNSAAVARSSGRDLHVVTSTRMKMAPEPNIHNFDPIWAGAMPGYANLELALPPWREMTRFALAARPDAVHVSTPGPVGHAGRRIAKRLGVPVLGVYHTDFPAYIDRLFEDRALTWLCSTTMRRFYAPFSRIFTRSAEYIDALEKLGIARSCCVRLRPGIRVQEFSNTKHDPHSSTITPAAPLLRALYVGRVSIEKNLPLLARVWSHAAPRLARMGFQAELTIVGDGPYRETMEHELAAAGVANSVQFLGFRYGVELTRLYAQSDVFVFPSLTDTLGQVVMEAQAAGLPVLVSDQGGPKEVVLNNETGLVLPGHEATAWTRAIVELASNEPRRCGMGRAAARHMQSFTIEQSFEHFWAVHEDVVHSARVSAHPSTIR